MSWLGDAVSDLGGAITNPVEAFRNSPIVNNPLVNPIATGTQMVTGISPADQYLAGAVVGTAIVGAPLIAAGSGVSAGTASAFAGIVGAHHAPNNPEIPPAQPGPQLDNALQQQSAIAPAAALAGVSLLALLMFL